MIPTTPVQTILSLTCNNIFFVCWFFLQGCFVIGTFQDGTFNTRILAPHIPWSTSSSSALFQNTEYIFQLQYASRSHRSCSISLALLPHILPPTLIPSSKVPSSLLSTFFFLPSSLYPRPPTLVLPPSSLVFPPSSLVFLPSSLHSYLLPSSL